MNKSLKIILLFAIGCYILNFIWEMLHFHLYSSQTLGMHNLFFITITSRVGLALYTSFIDTFWIFAVFILIALIDKEVKWKINVVNSVLFSILLIAIAMIMERIGLARGLWVYSSYMPVIFRIGLSPLVQLIVTGWISLLIVRKLIKE